MIEVPKEEAINRYTTIIGKIPNKYLDQLSSYDISDPNSELLLEHCVWDDYKSNNAYHNCIVKDSDYYVSLTKQYSFSELKDSVELFAANNSAFKWHLDQMDKNYLNFKSKEVTTEEKKGCALTLSYYTGFKENSDRTSTNTNAIIRGENSFNKNEKWYDGKQFYPIINYLSKAVSNLPMYYGYTTRCVQLTKDQIYIYEPGTVVTWLTWISSKVGKNASPYFSGRNTWFYIYSFNARDISNFSIYSTEKEGLYSPFSHFLVFKKEYSKDKYNIYMRQIEIGLYINNIVWVDDNIFNSKWEYKHLMEMACYKNKYLKIIPKNSTDTAMAFLISFKPFIKTGNIKYKIISNMNRKNENSSHNAGARLVKKLQENGFDNIEIMIFTSSKDEVFQEFRRLSVIMNDNIKITNSPSDVTDFLIAN